MLMSLVPPAVHLMLASLLLEGVFDLLGGQEAHAHLLLLCKVCPGVHDELQKAAFLTKP